MARDPEILAHLEWLGYVQPTGLVVSIPALLAAQAQVGRANPEDHQRFLASLPRAKDDEVIPEIPDLPLFLQSVLHWDASDLQLPPDSLEVTLTEYNETLRPTYVVPEFQPKDPQRPWLALVQCLPRTQDFDTVHEQDDRHWQTTPQARFERLLRETEIPIGLLFNNSKLRLVYAPRGETSGYATFGVADMASVAGRPIFAALRMLLSNERLFSLPEKQRLAAILADSRKYQNVVSTQLAQQVLAALFELLRGFQAADDATKGLLLRDVLASDPNHVYAGLLTVLMRLVFILYAEDRGLLSTDAVYVNHYSVTGLFDRLRADAGRHPDTMDQRYGAWSQLLTLFRLIHEGGSHGAFRIPARNGYLFDPERYAFLEGRTSSASSETSFESVPRVADGVLFRVLSNLLVLDGERLSYRTLDVEQIGGVYETMMGFDLEVAKGRSIAIKPAKSHGAPTSINLEELLAAKSGDRAKWLAEQTDQKLTGKAAEALKSAATIDELLAALEKKIADAVTPNTVPKGAMIFQPSDERRRSGSHYTPRSLTAPIVRKTLEPILKQLGERPTPKQILDLKVCDPTMGSGAFLVEACRQLGDVLVKAWHLHNQVPRIPPDEDEILHARRLIAQRSLYGVDKNPMAVDLSKLSLWLATLAKDHPFTFLDHSLRCGDSLVGLTKEQIRRFTWEEGKKQMLIGQERLVERIETATRYRRELLETGDEVPFLLKQQKLALADESLNLVRFAGNLVIAAFFVGDNDKKRKAKREELLRQFSEFLRTGDMALRPTKAEHELRSGDKAIQPFHWEIEFPELFGRGNGGFDAIVGNPPFMGGTYISGSLGVSFKDWIYCQFPESGDRMDLVAYFFRRSFSNLRDGGCFGLIATNTIRQGDTRYGGLRWICEHGGSIYSARRRVKWPGQAAVVVSVVHVSKNQVTKDIDLDGELVPKITAYLFHAGGNGDPSRLSANCGKASKGSDLYGMGFTFDDTDKKGIASSLGCLEALLVKDSRNRERVFPYFGGEEVNESPNQAHYRYVINFEDMSLDQAEQWPDLLSIVERKVKPDRLRKAKEVASWPWWQHWRIRRDLYNSLANKKRALALSRVGDQLAFAFLPTQAIYSDSLVVFSFDTCAAFCNLQSRIHEVWVRFFGSSMKDDLRYTSSDCFETFPFPDKFESDAKLETVGRQYYEFRAALMVKNDEGLTKTYNRFHDRDHDATETNQEIVVGIQKLRELHAAMDRAVLNAYGWHDLKPSCEFLLDYEDDEADDEGEASGRHRKKPWRYRWPDDFRDEVLARLLELNKQRAEQERLSGEAAEAATKPAKRPRKNAAKKKDENSLPGF